MRSLMNFSFKVFCLVLIGTILGCKKGDNDPVFSIKSRKARLTGEWTVKSAVWSVNDTTWTLVDSTLTMNDGVTEETRKAKIILAYTNLGDYTHEEEITYPEDYPDSSLAGNTCATVESGAWNFTGGAGDTRTKSQLLHLNSKQEFSCQNQVGNSNISTVSTTGQTIGVVYTIDRLTDKELILKYDEVVNTPGAQISKKGEFNLTKVTTDG